MYTDVIMKIIDTVHTAGINSFSMYEHFTLHDPLMVLPKQNTKT